MQRNISSKNMSSEVRAAIKLKAMADGQDPSGWTDEQLAEYAGESGEPGKSQGESGESGKSQGESGESGKSQMQSNGEPPPADNPMEQQIQDIARKLDIWQNKNEIQPTLALFSQAVEQGLKNVEAVAAAAAEKIAKTASETSEPQVIHVHAAKGKAVKVLNDPHPAAEIVLRAIRAGVNVMLVGPAGSGKTTLCEQVAEGLGLDFYFTGAVSMEFKLSGHIDGHGQFHAPQFYQAFKNGGLFLFDEYDVSSNQALLAFNAALANGFADFPCGQVKRHPDFVAIAAANTYGTGADREYVGRLQVDAAALDRFAVLDLDYDESNEHNWARAALGLETSAPKRRKNPYGECDDSREFTSQDVDDWVTLVQRYRKASRKVRVRHVISPRASITGAKLLAAGLPEKLVQKMTIWKGLDSASVDKIREAA